MLALLLATALAAPFTDFDLAFEAALREDLAARAPAALEPWDAANAAREAGDGATAIAGYERVWALAPGFDAARRRQCDEEMRLQRLDAAEAHCDEALATTTSTHNELAVARVRFVRDDLDGALAHLDAALALPDASPYLPIEEARLRAGVAWSRKDGRSLRTWSERLTRLAPELPEGWLGVAVGALDEGDRAAARRAIARAREAGADPASLKSLEEATASPEDLAVPALEALGGWLAVWAVLAAATMALSWWTSRLAARMLADPASATHVNPSVRRVYRWAMQLLCAVYYLSLPVVALVSLALGAFFFLLALGLRRLWPWPIYAGVMTVVAVLGAAFARVRQGVPGDPVDLAAEPRLREVLDEVAAGVGTAAVDEVYLEPGTRIAVTELPSVEGTKRALLLGVGVLDGLSLASFQSILAHEYGHFSNGDTAGGDFALRVRRSFWELALGLGKRGLATWVNPAWAFVRGFERLFLLTSFGASRLQELHADRTAARLYGAEPFVEGLTHVVRASAFFDARTLAVVNDAITRGVPLTNLYTHEPERAPDLAAAERAAEASLDRAPTAWDSHPPPAVRFAWVRGLEAAHGAGTPPSDGATAWSLFRDRAAVEAQMTAIVRAKVAASHGVRFVEG